MCGILGVAAVDRIRSDWLLVTMRGMLSDRSPTTRVPMFGRRASRQLDHSRRKGSLSHSVAASRLGLLRQEHPARGRFGVFDRVTAQGVIESHRRGYRKAQRSLALALFELWR